MRKEGREGECRRTSERASARWLRMSALRTYVECIDQDLGVDNMLSWLRWIKNKTGLEDWGKSFQSRQQIFDSGIESMGLFGFQYGEYAFRVCLHASGCVAVFVCVRACVQVFGECLICRQDLYKTMSGFWGSGFEKWGTSGR